ncbi:YcxB family protein [Gracilibacillus salinarum]|uniref:YcxB family protein n=1 Tax=Gracilibacillus salinarum TaxID=2932255 RepID=UPI0034E19F8B
MYTINNNGINQQVGRSNVFINWNDIVKGYEHKEMFCLYISSSKAILLPKRYFASNDDKLVFKKLVRQNTNKVKLKSS